MDSLVAVDAQSVIGHGFLSGFTWKIKNWDVDVNYTQCQKPLTSLEGETVWHGDLLIGVSCSN